MPPRWHLDVPVALSGELGEVLWFDATTCHAKIAMFSQFQVYSNVTQKAEIINLLLLNWSFLSTDVLLYTAWSLVMVRARAREPPTDWSITFPSETLKSKKIEKLYDTLWILRKIIQIFRNTSKKISNENYKLVIFTTLVKFKTLVLMLIEGCFWSLYRVTSRSRRQCSNFYFRPFRFLKKNLEIDFKESRRRLYIFYDLW